MKQWEKLIGNIDQLAHILQEYYTKIKPLVIYLDTEDGIKSDLNVQSPAHKISEDAE